MDDLRKRLTALRLTEYIEIFENAGFDTWRTLCLIQEEDLQQLKVKLGHRRILQSAILKETQYQQNYEKCGTASDASSITDAPRPKRRYRRHPKPDVNALKRPLSAYHSFANDARERLKHENLDFAQSAKAIGQEWKNTPPEIANRYHKVAKEEKEAYKTGMKEYRKSEDFAWYEKYVENWRAKHGKPAKRDRSGSDVRGEIAAAPVQPDLEGKIIDRSDNGIADGTQGGVYPSPMSSSFDAGNPHAGVYDEYLAGDHDFRFAEEDMLGFEAPMISGFVHHVPVSRGPSEGSMDGILNFRRHSGFVGGEFSDGLQSSHQENLLRWDGHLDFR